MLIIQNGQLLAWLIHHSITSHDQIRHVPQPLVWRTIPQTLCGTRARGDLISGRRDKCEWKQCAMGNAFAECLLDVINQSYCFIPVVQSSLLTIIIIIVLLPVMFSGAIIQQQMSVRDMSS